MRLTKTDMARVIVQALYGLDYLPPAANAKVQRMMRRSTVEHLKRQHKLALKIFEGVKKSYITD